MSLKTNKSLGQHWLHDAQVINRIAQNCLSQGAKSVIEIGPGTGALTKALLGMGATVTVIEIDDRCATLLEGWPETRTGQLTVVRADALEADWPNLLAKTQANAVVGNLPYNVGTEITVRLLTLPKPPARLVFLLQKEVVQRLTAQANTEHWGRLGVLADLLTNRRQLFTVGKGAFSPPPKVESAVVELTPLPTLRYPVNMDNLDKLLRAGFGQRRKMLRSALKGLLNESQIAALGIAPTARAETLTTAQLCQLANLLS
jgi:16S rRNA (adenine1518-N6/adenine1519-N6)-dimethyltransferase